MKINREIMTFSPTKLILQVYKTTNLFWKIKHDYINSASIFTGYMSSLCIFIFGIWSKQFWLHLEDALLGHVRFSRRRSPVPHWMLGRNSIRTCVHRHWIIHPDHEQQILVIIIESYDGRSVPHVLGRWSSEWTHRSKWWNDPTCWIW